MAVAEALASGTPAIVTKGAPWAGLQHPQAGGWWIDIGIDALVACLEAALGHSEDKLQAMGQRGRSWMLADYSWAHVGRQMAEVYRWVLNGDRKPESVLAE